MGGELTGGGADGGGAGLVERAAAAAQVFLADLDHPVLEPADERHLSRSLRLRDGEPVVASDGSGGWRGCRFRVARRGDGDAALEPDGPVRREPAPPFDLTVAFAPVKGDRPEWVVQKLTELGVDRLVPLLADRSVVRWSGERGRVAVERLRRVAREAAAQSRRVRLPEVAAPTALAMLAERPALADLGGAPPAPGVHAVAVGPEGGWSDRERGMGLPTLGLGPRVLRAETAAVAAGVLLSAFRDGLVRGGPAPVASGEGRAPPGRVRRGGRG
ncbi:MAG: RsmE family RNA methyltransferase [Acidimicrobiales bacterium]